MRKMLMIAALGMLASGAARAADVTIQVTDQWRPTLANASALLDQCVGGATVRGDMTACRGVSQFLANLAQLATTPVPTPAPVPPPPTASTAPPATPTPATAEPDQKKTPEATAPVAEPLTPDSPRGPAPAQ